MRKQLRRSGWYPYPSDKEKALQDEASAPVMEIPGFGSVALEKWASDAQLQESVDVDFAVFDLVEAVAE